MSATEEMEDDSSILQEDPSDDKNQPKIPTTNAEDDDMLLLSSSSASSSPSSNHGSLNPTARPDPSGMNPPPEVIRMNPPPEVMSGMNPPPEVISLDSSNIVIPDSDSEESEGFDNRVEVIDSEDEEDEEDDDEIESDSDNSHSSFLDGKVQIFMAHGSFFIWNAEDVQMVREECRIVGKLGGCLPRAPRQNNQLGLPLQLMPEEAKLLEEIEAACVVEEQEATEEAAQIRTAAFRKMREENYMAQQQMYKESRKAELHQHKAQILQGKKAKKRKLEELKKGEEGGEKTGDASTNSTTDEKPTEQSGEEKSDETKVGKTSAVACGSKSDLKVKSGDDKSEKTETDMDEDEDEEAGNSRNVEMDTDAAANVSDPFPEVAEGGSRLSNKQEEEEEEEEESEDGPMGPGSQACGKPPVKGAAGGVLDGEDEDEEREDDDDDEEEEEFNVDAIVTTETHVKHSLIQLFTENPWKESVKRTKHWIFPLSQKELLRFEVFKDLWRKGYFLTSGSKFGGDFLVYPGDPSRFHSHFIAVCVDKSVDLSALDIISLGRLGSNVRKTVLLCALNKFRQVVYTSLRWTGIS